MEWHPPQSSQKKEFKMSSSAGKFMITVICGCEGVVLVHVMPRDDTVNSNACTRTLTELAMHFR
jgi:hypothetical protein